MTEDEERIEGGRCDQAYDDHIARVTEPPSITCPVCHMTSYNHNDIREGYCGKCHAWTRGASVCRMCGRTAPLIGHICEECHREILEPKP